MVDHPDFCSEHELEKAKATMPIQILRDQAEEEEEDDDDDEETAVENGDKRGAPKISHTDTDGSGASNVAAIDAAIATFNPAMQRRSLSSIRAGVTVSMVAVALGFACCKFVLQMQSFDLYVDF